MSVVRYSGCPVCFFTFLSSVGHVGHHYLSFFFFLFLRGRWRSQNHVSFCCVKTFVMLFKITWSFSYYYQSDTLFCGDDEDRNGYIHTHSDTAKLQKLSQNDALRRLNLSLDKNPNSTLDVGVLWHAFVCTMCNCTCREMPKRRKIQIHANEWNIWMGYSRAVESTVAR